MTINLTAAALVIVKADVSSARKDGLRYAEYVAEMSVTLSTVADHVGAFRDEYKRATATALKTAQRKAAKDGNAENLAALAIAESNASGDAVKAYATKVRNGLNRTLGKGSGDKSEPTALITTLGKAATLEQVTAAWKAAQA